MTVISRRTVLTGAAATGAASAVGAVNVPIAAIADDQADLQSFIEISAALTGIDVKKLVPFLDPIDIKQTYFNKAQKDSAFNDLLDRWRKRPVGSDAGVLLKDPDPVRYLARNIMIAWYLGAWCDPAELAKYDGPNPPPGPPPTTVITAVAYTQGWAWRAAQAHPMGYSDLRFGYWADQPFTLEDLTGVA